MRLYTTSWSHRRPFGVYNYGKMLEAEDKRQVTMQPSPCYLLSWVAMGEGGILTNHIARYIYFVPWGTIHCNKIMK